MPAYGIAQAGGVLTSVLPGDQEYLFNAESPAAPQASVAISRGYAAQGDEGITFTIEFNSAPTAQVNIEGSNDGVTWVVLYQSINLVADSYTDKNRFAFYRANLISESAGLPVTVIAQR